MVKVQGLQSRLGGRGQGSTMRMDSGRTSILTRCLFRQWFCRFYCCAHAFGRLLSFILLFLWRRGKFSIIY